MPIDIKKVQKATDDFFNQFEPKEVEEEQAAPAPRDFYEEYQDAYSKQPEMPHGARAKVAIDADVVLNKLPMYYKAAKHTVDQLMRNGEKSRAQMTRDAYMNEKFLPAITALVHTNSADALMNASGILDLLDSYAMVNGGQAKGFTRSFVRSLYGSDVGGSEPFSDSVTRECVEDLKRLVATNNIRTAVGRATKMLQKIDNGEQSANSDDYALIQKVALLGQ